MKLSVSLFTLAMVLGSALAQTVVTVSSTPSHSIPPLLWGQMFEDISHSGDGGLYAELLQNRAFQLVTPGTSAALAGWTPSNNGKIAVIADPTPVSSALPNSLQLSLPAGTVTNVGFANVGYNDGFKIEAGKDYKASFHYRLPAGSSFKGTLAVSLVDSTTSTSPKTLASTTISLSPTASTGKWDLVELTLRPSSSSASTKNQFVITASGSGSSASQINFAMLSLFPPTFKGRPNGMRVDIAEALAEMGPSFFRLPGGNNLEGQTVATRWQWNATLGPLVDRPGRFGDWGYTNTDGLGLLEYLEWCEDVGMEPIMAVWAGYALGGTSVAENQLSPYIQQAIDQINFVIGDPTKSAAAARRAALGHPVPFSLKYVEIGNEDFFAATSYVYRWKDFVTALKAEFPNIHFIATSNDFAPILSPNPTEYDNHVYQTPTWFYQNAFMYDGYQRNGTKYFEGEYAAISTNPNNIFGAPGTGRLVYPTMESAAGEAAFMTGLERNSDIVFAASYAPLLGHVTANQWTPNLLAFDAANTYRSTSYYVQKMFSLNRGTEFLPSTLPSKTGTLFWSVVRDGSRDVIIKISNVASTSATLSFVLPFTVADTKGSVEVLTGPATQSNTPQSPNAFAPVTSSITVGKNFNYTAPAVSVSVLRIKTA